MEGVKAARVIGGKACETFVLDRAESGDPPPGYHIVVIPGNPGMVDFYIPFIQYLSSHFEQKIPISAISHAGHTNWIGYPSEQILSDSGVYSLNEQIEHKADYLENLLKEHSEQQAQMCLTPTPLKFILIGHSVGSFVCLKLRKMNRFGVPAVINLFPTFQHLYEGLSPSIQWLIQPGLRHMVSMFTGIVPVSLKRYLVREYSTGLGTAAQDVVAAGFNRYSVLNNVLYMAKTEGQDICELDPELIEPLTSTHFLYGTADQYTPMEQINKFRMEYPNANVLMADESCKHAFCVCPDQSKIVAKVTANFIQENCSLSYSP